MNPIQQETWFYSFMTSGWSGIPWKKGRLGNVHERLKIKRCEVSVVNRRHVSHLQSGLDPPGHTSYEFLTTVNSRTFAENKQNFKYILPATKEACLYFNKFTSLEPDVLVHLFAAASGTS